MAHAAHESRGAASAVATRRSLALVMAAVLAACGQSTRSPAGITAIEVYEEALDGDLDVRLSRGGTCWSQRMGRGYPPRGTAVARIEEGEFDRLAGLAVEAGLLDLEMQCPGPPGETGPELSQDLLADLSSCHWCFWDEAMISLIVRGQPVEISRGWVGTQRFADATEAFLGEFREVVAGLDWQPQTP